MQKGVFITFEGGEGGGKSTQLRRLAEHLRRSGKEVVTTREPGGTVGAEAIRHLLVEGNPDQWDAICETLLFLAARRDHYMRIIQPALQAGKTVLCDRFADSTIVYQGIGKGLGIEYVKALSRLSLGTLTPDITLLLDISPQHGLKRATLRADKENRFEALGLEFHQRIREGFLQLAKAEPQRICVIDATLSEREVADAINYRLETIIISC